MLRRRVLVSVHDVTISADQYETVNGTVVSFTPGVPGETILRVYLDEEVRVRTITLADLRAYLAQRDAAAAAVVMPAGTRPGQDR